jgi:S1-C subfamily serine protease
MLLIAACDDDSNGNDGTPAASSETSGASGGGVQGGSNQQVSNDIAEVANTVKPAVVSITSEQVQLGQFNQTFTIPQGVGTGVIYDDDGHILTNNHVIEGAQRLTVTLTDGRTFEAELVGGDPRTDLAVLKIEADDLPVAELGDSESLVVGEWVVAIGNALGLPGGPTVTAGVVSALDRTVQEPGNNGEPGPFLFDVIQTDASINPGNSGGPLVDLDGKVIGINTLVAAQAAPGVPAQGIGFAIAINAAKPVAEELVQNGGVDHAYLGVVYVPLNAAIAAQTGAPVQHGALVVEVVPGSPADQGGLLPDDIIAEVNGTEIKGESDLAEVLFRLDPGDTATLTILRDGAEQEVRVTLGEAPD